MSDEHERFREGVKIVSQKCPETTYFWEKMTYIAQFLPAYFLFAERQIDGNIFASMSREDIATIFPQPEKFMGMKLYRIVQNVRSSSSSQTDVNTCQLLNHLDAHTTARS